MSAIHMCLRYIDNVMLEPEPLNTHLNCHRSVHESNLRTKQGIFS